jgi:hypothetical protein
VEKRPTWSFYFFTYAHSPCIFFLFIFFLSSYFPYICYLHSKNFTVGFVSKSACQNYTHACGNHTLAWENHTHACGNNILLWENHTLRTKVTLMCVAITLGRVFWKSERVLLKTWHVSNSLVVYIHRKLSLYFIFDNTFVVPFHELKTNKLCFREGFL